MLSYIDMQLEEKGVGKLGSDNVKSQAGVIGDYKSLYSSKHFRNRIIRLQKLCETFELDAIVLILGKHFLQLGSCHSRQML